MRQCSHWVVRRWARKVRLGGACSQPSISIHFTIFQRETTGVLATQQHSPIERRTQATTSSKPRDESPRISIACWNDYTGRFTTTESSLDVLDGQHHALWRKLYPSMPVKRPALPISREKKNYSHVRHRCRTANVAYCHATVAVCELLRRSPQAPPGNIPGGYQHSVGS